MHEQGERDGAPDAVAGLPGARTLRASANACSMPHRAAYRATRATGLAGQVGGDQGQVVAAGGALVAG
ncbi:MAG TPA: hypothetical protein VHS32_02220 [Streptosporangiaceae bacterium]|nr:hypothetical protein [Streptosporangiaceae bacterium]